MFSATASQCCLTTILLTKLLKCCRQLVYTSELFITYCTCKSQVVKQGGEINFLPG